MNSPNIFRDSLSKNDIFCFGYSDDDPDVFPILADTQNRIFWYLYDIENIPNSLVNLKQKKGNDLIFIYRHFGDNFPGKSEKCFHNSLSEIFKLNEYETEIFNIQSKYEIDPELTVNKRLDHYRSLVKESIDSNPEASIQICRYFLGCILFSQNKLDESRDLLDSIQTSRRDTDLLFYKNQQIAGVYEAKSDPEEARKCWEDNYEVFCKEDRFKQYKEFSEVRLASTKIKVWKRNALDVRSLLDGIDTLIEKTKDPDPNIYTIAFLGLADLCHHIAEYLPFILIGVITNSSDEKEKIKSFGKKHSQTKIAFLIYEFLCLTGVRNILMLLSGYLYKFVADDNRSRNYQYKVLCQLRLIELHSAIKSEYPDLNLKALSISNYQLDRIRDYYLWANINEGVGNTFLTDGIREFFNGNFEIANVHLCEALKYYQNDTTGIVKCKIYQLRLKEKIFNKEMVEI